jgi:hypothetical protein
MAQRPPLTAPPASRLTALRALAVDHMGWAPSVMFSTRRPMGPQRTDRFGQQVCVRDNQRGTSPDRAADGDGMAIAGQRVLAPAPC